tara:strand:- start:649 stop:2445 length:1797 start_codon:yes stop_codon:yes gene_type:complete
MSNYKDLKNNKFSTDTSDFSDIVDTGTAGTKVSVGTTAQRGTTQGQFRFNSTTGLAEYYDGSIYKSIDVNPTVTNVDISEVDSTAGGNQTVVITGTNFLTGAIASFVGSSASFNASTTTIDSATQITAVAPKSSFLNAQEPYGVKVTNSVSGLSGTLTNQINVDSAPTWTTASGNIADIGESDTGTHVTVAASDAEGDTIAYSVQSGSLPGGLSLNSSTGAISGDPTDVGAHTTSSFTLRATANSKTADRAFNIIVRDSFAGGNQSVTDIETLAQSMLYASNANVQAGGTLTVNSLALGNYEYYKTSGATTISSFTEANYFSSTEDTVSSFLIFNGNLTLNAGQTIIPVKRKLFTVVYVNGNLAVNGAIKMTARGANHSGTGNSGGATTAQNIKMITGTYSSVADATIPAAGGAGAASKTGSHGSGYDGTDGPARGSGGGASGGLGDGSVSSGAGAAGTSFSGGPGGGGADNSSASAATANGGAGGNHGGANAGGGAGNPIGSGSGLHASQNTGTGGTLIVYCTGTLSGSGSIEAKATDGSAPSSGYRNGGAAGGGIVQIFCDSGTVTTSAAGGTTAGSQPGGDGGDGSANIYTGYSG